MAALDEAKRQRGDAAGSQDDPESVRALGGVARNVREPAPPDEQGDDADGNVDQEHQSPIGGDEQPADHRPEPGGEAADSSPRPYCAMPTLGFVRGQQQPERGRVSRAAPAAWPSRNPTSMPTLVEAAHAAEAAVKMATPSKKARSRVPVSQPAEKNEQRLVHDGVAVQDPRQLAEIASPDIRAIWGRATFTMKRSRLARTTPAQTIMSTWRGLAVASVLVALTGWPAAVSSIMR